MNVPLTGFSVGVTETIEHVTFNLPPDDLTPGGATLLLTAEQARRLISLLTQAATLVEAAADGNNGHRGN